MKRILFSFLIFLSLASSSFAQATPAQDTLQVVFTESVNSDSLPLTTLTDTGVWVARAINTTEMSDTNIATLSGDTITLKPGTYVITASTGADVSPSSTIPGSIKTQLRVRQLSNGFVSEQTLLTGGGQTCAIAPYKSLSYLPLTVQGVVIVSGTTWIQLQQYITPTPYTFDAGAPVNSGEPEIYTRIMISKTK